MSSTATNSSERTKICSGCGKEFGCCTHNCWCGELPQIIPLPEAGDCLCPECLQALIGEKIKG